MFRLLTQMTGPGQLAEAGLAIRRIILERSGDDGVLATGERTIAI
jgi:hypothetical protein